MTLRERLKRLRHNILIVCWLGILLICILGIIESYIDRNPYALAIFIGITMLVYWGTGVLTCLLKGWRLDK